MRRFFSLCFFFLLLSSSSLTRANSTDDAIRAWGDCNDKINEVKTFSFNDLASGKTEISSMLPPFQALAAALPATTLGPLGQMAKIVATIQAKINATAGSVNISVFSNGNLPDLMSSLNEWQQLMSLADFTTALQQYVAPTPTVPATPTPQPTATVAVTAAANAAGASASSPFPPIGGAAVPALPAPSGFPALPGAAGAAAALGAPTPTPAMGAPTPAPTLSPTPVPTAATSTSPTPVAPGDGGVIPGGWNSAPAPAAAAAAAPVPGFSSPASAPHSQVNAPVLVMVGHLNQRLWVANVHSSSVSVMDVATQRFVAQVTVGSQPQSLGLDDTDDNLVVANYGSNNVTLVDAKGDVVLKTFPVAAGPSQVLVTHAGKAYILCQDGKTIAVIDLKLRLLLKSIAMSSRPGHMDQSATGGQIFVSLPDEDSLAVIDTSYDDVVATIRE
jgi:YVTN family beta-propeller protein